MLVPHSNMQLPSNENYLGQGGRDDMNEHSVTRIVNWFKTMYFLICGNWAECEMKVLRFCLRI